MAYFVSSVIITLLKLKEQLEMNDVAPHLLSKR